MIWPVAWPEKEHIMKYYEKPIETDGFTVRELMDLLKDADPDAIIVVGKDVNHCDGYLYGVGIGTLVGFFTCEE